MWGWGEVEAEGTLSEGSCLPLLPRSSPPGPRGAPYRGSPLRARGPPRPGCQGQAPLRQRRCACLSGSARTPSGKAARLGCSATFWDTRERFLIASLLNSSVQSLSRVPLFETPWIAARQASLSWRGMDRIINSQSLLKLIESVMPSNHLILCRPLLLLPSIFPSIRVFSNESVYRIRWPQVLEFQLQHQSFQRIFRTYFL